MANQKSSPVKIFKVDEETIIEHKGEEKTLLELKNIYNHFHAHDDKEIQKMCAEIKKVIDKNE